MRCMQYIPRDLQGRLYDNREDRTDKKQPDFTGVVCVGGELYRVAAWKNTAGIGGLHKTNLSIYLTPEAEAKAADAVRDAKEKAKSQKGREQVDFSFLMGD